MWTSERRLERRAEESAALGQVTLGGDPAGVFLGGERRWLPVYSPGGYCWRPGAGDRVLVVQAGDGRESRCITGRRQAEKELEPEEVRISGGTGGVRLYSGGTDLTGEVSINGQGLEEMIEAIVARALAASAAGGGGHGAQTG